MEGKSMTPHGGRYSSLGAPNINSPHLSLRHFLNRDITLQGPSNSHCALPPKLGRYQDIFRCVVLGMVGPGHSQEQLTKA